MDEELERFKRDVRLHEYAASLGYELDKRDSSPLDVVMRRGGHKISIRKDADGHYVYYSFRDESDHGTIMDFVMRRQPKNFGEARKALRSWAGTPRPLSVYQHLEPAPRFDRAAVQAAWSAIKDLRWHDYLEKERCLPRPAVLSPRFKGCIRVDARANAIFPHHDEEGLCGFESATATSRVLRNSRKGLSVKFRDDRALVIGESAIDSISHACLFPAPARYASIAGGLNPKQPALIAAACAELPSGSEVVCITHADKDGERYAGIIQEAAGPLPFRIHRPEGVKDWNDVIRARAAAQFRETNGLLKKG